MCNVLTDPTGCASDVAASGVKALADSFVDGATWAVKAVTTSWMGIPSPDLMDHNSPVYWISSRLEYFVWVALFCSILVAAYRLATTGDHRHGLALGGSFMRLFIVSGVLGIVVTLCLAVGDAFASWILDQASLGKTTAALLATLAAGGGIPDALRFVVAGAVIVAQLVQMGLMIIKNVLVIVLVAVIPLTAAMTNTERGFMSYQKAITWLGAFIIYKPVVALLYALAFRMLDPKGGVFGMVSGVALMGLAIFSLPALIRFMAPIGAAASGGNAGAIAGATVGAALATGAVVATAGTGAGGFAAAGGASSAGIAPISAPTGAAVASAIPPPSGSGAASQQADEAIER